MTNDFRPRCGAYRLMLPCDAEWTRDEDPEVIAALEREK